jgi:hypothetical protein
MKIQHEWAEARSKVTVHTRALEADDCTIVGQTAAS